VGVNRGGRKGELDVLDLGRQVQLVLGHPGGLPAQHEVERGAQGEHVDALVLGEVRGGVGQKKLGRHERGGAAVGHLVSGQKQRKLTITSFCGV
jgi:hypothetical protein